MDVLTWILTIFLIGLVALWFYLRRNYGQLDGMGLPIIKPFLCFGSPPFLLNKIVWHEWNHQKFKELGRTFVRYSGSTPEICTIDPELIKEITVKQFENFSAVFDFDLPAEHTTLDMSK